MFFRSTMMALPHHPTQHRSATANAGLQQPMKATKGPQQPRRPCYKKPSTRASEKLFTNANKNPHATHHTPHPQKAIHKGQRNANEKPSIKADVSHKANEGEWGPTWHTTPLLTDSFFDFYLLVYATNTFQIYDDNLAMSPSQHRSTTANAGLRQPMKATKGPRQPRRPRYKKPSLKANKKPFMNANEGPHATHNTRHPYSLTGVQLFVSPSWTSIIIAKLDWCRILCTYFTILN